MAECEGCKFWIEEYFEGMRDDELKTGICRFNPPVSHFIDGVEEFSRRWPLAYADEWRGKFEKRS